MGKIGELMFGKMKDDSIKLCIQLLQDSAEENVNLVNKYKNKDFEYMFCYATGAILMRITDK